jgi:hypothetical protein
MPQVGWFGDVEVGILKPNLKNQLINTVTFTDGTTAIVGLPAARLDWTASPRFEVGYRLPSGFGEVSLAYRFMVSQGTETVIGPDGPATLKSRLDVNLVDLDYSSQEFTPWDLWDMKFHLGVRYFYLYFDSRATESFEQAAAGAGIFDSRSTDSYVGIGPHAGVDLSRKLGWGICAVGKFDGSTAWGRIRQGFFASPTTPGPDGQPQVGQVRVSGSQEVPIFRTNLGLSWRPTAHPNVYVFAGYQFEYWWNAGRYNPSATPPGSFGDFYDNGFVLRAAINF